jgi:NAD+ synthase (glutamine-hydrolysing)
MVLETRMLVALAQLNFAVGSFDNRDWIVIPVSTLTKPPSAALRPNQKDTDTLPPYEILDQIVEAYVERDLDVEAICELGLDRTVVADVVRRIDRSEYKRRQATPGLKISSKAFGVGRWYPMAADYQALIASRALAPETSPP